MAKDNNLKDSVTPEMTMGEIVERFPEAIEVLQGWGLHCVGCHVSTWETLAEGGRNHGMSEEEIKEMMADVNKAIASADASGNKVNLTVKAAEKIKAILSREGKKEYAIRIEALDSPGPMPFAMSFDDERRDADEAVEEKGLRFYYDKKDSGKIDGIKIDYIETISGGGFRISKPTSPNDGKASPATQGL